MVKIVEFDDVYLEYPDEEELSDETKETIEDFQGKHEENYKDEKESRTTRLSLEELQQKLEETQTLHL